MTPEQIANIRSKHKNDADVQALLNAYFRLCEDMDIIADSVSCDLNDILDPDGLRFNRDDK